MAASILTIALPSAVIGSNFMAEWQAQQRLELQLKMQRKHKKLQSSNHRHNSNHINHEKSAAENGHHSFASSHLKLNYHEVENRLLLQQNGLILTCIAEIQEKLNDINPPHYFLKYKECQAQCDYLKNKVTSLDKELSHYKEQYQVINDNLTTAEHNGHSVGAQSSLIQRLIDKTRRLTHGQHHHHSHDSSHPKLPIIIDAPASNFNVDSSGEESYKVSSTRTPQTLLIAHQSSTQAPSTSKRRLHRTQSLPDSFLNYEFNSSHHHDINKNRHQQH